METTDLKFFGAGGHAKVVIDAWIASGGSVVAIYDDDARINSILKYPVRHSNAIDEFVNCKLFISVGSNTARRSISKRLKGSYASIIHPSAVIAGSAHVGEGTVVMAGAVVNADTAIGDHVIVNTSAVIEHDCSVGSFAHVSPGAVICGGVTIGEGTQIGAGAVVVQNVSIGSWAVVGAGAVITRNVPDNAVVVGAPGRIVRYVSNEG